MADEETQKKTKLFCIRCNRITNHFLKGMFTSREEDTSPEMQGYWEQETAELYMCAGCEAPKMVVFWEDATDAQAWTTYPARANSWVRVEKTFHKLPIMLRAVYAETLAAYNNDLHLLATVGLRTLLEGVCVDLKAEGKTLGNKIDALGAHFGSKNITKHLHGYRFSGNAAAHELEPMNRRELNTAIDVMEDLLNYLYDLDYKASRLKQSKTSSTAKALLPEGDSSSLAGETVSKDEEDDLS